MSIAWKYGYVSFTELCDWVRAHPTDIMPVPLCLWGPPGIGKSAIIESYCHERNLGFRVYHPANDLNSGDIVGMRYLEEGTVHYARPDWLPVADRNPDGTLSWKSDDDARGGILFIDEINRANPTVLQGLMELLGKGTIHQSNWELPPGWSIVCAANPNEKGFQVTPLDPAMINRMLHYAPGWQGALWSRWAESTRLDPRVIDFVLGNPDMVDGVEAELPVEVMPDPTRPASPRAWSMFAALLDPEIPLKVLDTVARGLLPGNVAEAIVESLSDHAAALPPKAIIQGDWGATMQAWSQPGYERFDLIRASTARLAAELVRLPASEDRRAYHVAERVRTWLLHLPSELVAEAIVEFREAVPQWLELIYRVDQDGQFAARVPPNPALIRRDPARIAEQREQMLEQRRVDRHQALRQGS